MDEQEIMASSTMPSKEQLRARLRYLVANKKEAEDVTKMMTVELLLYLGESLNNDKSGFDVLSLKEKVNIFKKIAEARKALDGVDVAIQLNQLQNQISKEEALRYLDGLERQTNPDSHGDDPIDITPNGQGSGEKAPA